LAGSGAVPVRQVLLTHAHPDHYGSAHQIALLTGTEVLGPELEADVFAGHAQMATPRLADWERPLFEQTMAHVPPPEQVGLDRLLRAGNALASHDGHPIVGVFSIDPAEATRTALRLLELEPTRLCVGHGTPLSGDVRGMFGQIG
jgi:glyoxylase-like metal-dependent hydrolase (beta-lactamase superfamily II)